ncbi:MAG: ATP-binding cassette domain-containing protein, partial [Steroidobacteraceae bacterium]
MTPASAIRLRGLRKRYGARDALGGIDLDLAGAQLVGLVGPDGAGKTTLIRLMAGLLEAEEGSLQVLGVDPAKEAEWVHASIGYMPQRFGLYEDLSVEENLRLYADLRGLPVAERASVFEELLSFTDLKRFASRLAGKLSGGMKQKLGLACALVCKPRLLLLDEPSVGVDPISRRELWSMVSGLKNEGVGVVWSTAYLDEAEACDHVLLLNQGKLLFDGRPQALTRRTEGRVFRMIEIEGRRRPILAAALDEPAVLAGVIQGRAIRLVARDASMPLTIPSEAGAHARLVPSPPRFEDSFIDALGGGPGGLSKLAESARTIAPSREPVIVAKGLTKRFGDFTAVDDLTLTVEPGTIFAFLGGNGSGKSTTIRMLIGLLRPTAGEIELDGIDVIRRPRRVRDRIGYMGQKVSLYQGLSLRENVEFYAGLGGLAGADLEHRWEALRERFALGDAERE